MTRKLHRYTKEQIQFLRENADGKRPKEIAELFNDHFETNLSVRSVTGVMYRNYIYTNTRGKSEATKKNHFKKGQSPWNKGKQGLKIPGSEKGWFKKGQVNPKQLPVGSERVEGGRMVVKVEQPNVWRKKHLVVWEKEHGKVPEDKVILFKDNDPMNVTIDNLFMSDQIAMLNVARADSRSKHPEINVAQHRVAELNRLITTKERTNE